MSERPLAPLKTLVVDDELPARQRLRKLLQPMIDQGRIQIVAEAGDGVEALEYLRSPGIDLLFLDIQMPELNGFDVLERLPPEHRPAVVFTTAFDAYALRAFEANAVDYLLKPITAERLAESVGRAERTQRTPDTRHLDNARLTRLLDWIEAHTETPEPPPAPPEREYLRQLSVPHRDRILIIPVSRLVSAEINEGITRLYVLEEEAGTGRGMRVRQHAVGYTLDQLEASLDPAAFMRVHRSAIVQLGQIQEMIPWFSGRFKLVLAGGHEVIASRERSRQLKDQMLL